MWVLGRNCGLKLSLSGGDRVKRMFERGFRTSEYLISVSLFAHCYVICNRFWICPRCCQARVAIEGIIHAYETQAATISTYTRDCCKLTTTRRCCNKRPHDFAYVSTKARRYFLKWWILTHWNPHVCMDLERWNRREGKWRWGDTLWKHQHWCSPSCPKWINALLHVHLRTCKIERMHLHLNPL